MSKASKAEDTEAGPGDELKLSSVRRRAICFTIYSQFTPAVSHDWIKECYAHLDELGKSDQVKNIVFQAEVCPKTKRDHVQGYIRYTEPKRFNAIHADLRGTTNKWISYIFVARGTAKQNLDYCTKSESAKPGFCSVQHGEDWESKQGARSDLSSAIEHVETYGLQAAWREDDLKATLVRYGRGLSELHARNQYDKVEAIRNVEVNVLMGLPGCGKTHFAVQGNIETWGKGNVYNWPAGKWMTRNYDQQKIAILDDFSGNWFSHTLAKQLFQGYKQEFEIKGDFCTPNIEEFYITTNYPPTNWWTDDVDRWSMNWQEQDQTGEIPKPPLVWLNGYPESPIERRVTRLAWMTGFYEPSLQRWIKPQIIYTLINKDYDYEWKRKEPQWQMMSYDRKAVNAPLLLGFIKRALLRRKIKKIFTAVMKTEAAISSLQQGLEYLQHDPNQVQMDSQQLAFDQDMKDLFGSNQIQLSSEDELSDFLDWDGSEDPELKALLDDLLGE